MSLYGIIADLRREHRSADATRTLDVVVATLGHTRDNLRLALEEISDKPVPPGGKKVLDELKERAAREGVDDLDYGPDTLDRPPLEPLASSEVGIGALLVITSIAGLVLAIVAVVGVLNSAFHFLG